MPNRRVVLHRHDEVIARIVSGIDDWGLAGPSLVVPQALGYVGSLLLLIWCFGVGRSSG